MPPAMPSALLGWSFKDGSKRVVPKILIRYLGRNKSLIGGQAIALGD